MNGEELLKTMSDVDGRLIVEAEKKPVRKRLFLGIAAAAAIAIAAGINVIPRITFTEPPVLDMSGKIIINNGMGYEGISADDPSELENGSPWSENMNISRLPVYKASSTYPDAEKMKEALFSTAEFFGLDIENLQIVDTTMSEEEIESLREQFKGYGASDEEIDEIVKNACGGGYVEASQNDIIITIDSAFTTSVKFENGTELPSGYNFGDGATEEELTRTGNYLIEEYGGLLNMKNPVINLNGEYSGSIELYDGGSSDGDKIVNYSLNLVRFIPNDEGKLWIIRILSDKGCEKIADYPVISADEAKTLLYEGKYLSSVTFYNITGEEEIGKIELTYISGIGYDYAMPFYRFLVKLPEELGGDYGGYYVPAVKGEYLDGIEAQYRYN